MTQLHLIFLALIVRVGDVCVIAGLALAGYAAYRWDRGDFTDSVPPDELATASVSVKPSRPAVLSAHEQIQVRHTEARIRQLEAMAQRRARVKTATSRTLDYRRQAQAEAVAAWTQVLETNHAKYLKLKAEAQQAPEGKVPCTLCDGFSYMPCVLCKHHDGKCIICNGTGRLIGRELCPACLGSGKCYLCNGSGKMLCPFCNDAMIEAHGHAPSALPPL